MKKIEYEKSNKQIVSEYHSTFATTIHQIDTYMILIDTMICQRLLTQFELFLIESTTNGKPSLIVQHFVTRLEENFAVLAMKTTIRLLWRSNHDFVTRHGQKGELLVWIVAVAFVDVHFVGFAINLVESVPAFSRPASALIVASNAP